jgi:recombination protein RecA
MPISLDIPNVMTGAQLEQQLDRRNDGSRWTCTALAGRLVELRGVEASGALTMAFSLVLDAQRAGEPVAWIAATDSFFYPPDVQNLGVDLEALAVVRVRGAQQAARAADRLVASNAFGLVVMDLGHDAWFPAPLQNRLVRRAESHETALVCVTREGREARHLGQMVSLRAEAKVEQLGDDDFRCTLRATKDKRARPGWTIELGCRGTVGLR